VWSEVGLTADVIWRLDNGTFIREETLSSKEPVSIRRWQLAVPTTYGEVVTEMNGPVRVDRFSAAPGTLATQLSNATFSFKTSIVASGNGPLGRGVHGAIPLHLMFE